MADTLTVMAGIGAGLLSPGSGVVCKAHRQPVGAFIGRDGVCQQCVEEGLHLSMPGWRQPEDPEWYRRQRAIERAAAWLDGRESAL